MRRPSVLLALAGAIALATAESAAAAGGQAAAAGSAPSTRATTWAPPPADQPGEAWAAAEPRAGLEEENPWRFQGRRWDPETGWGFFRLRYLDAEAGRWVSRDPLGVWGDPGQLGNAYSAFGNDPVNSVDPWGLMDNFEQADLLENAAHSYEELSHDLKSVNPGLSDSLKEEASKLIGLSYELRRIQDFAAWRQNPFNSPTAPFDWGWPESEPSLGGGAVSRSSHCPGDGGDEQLPDGIRVRLFGRSLGAVTLGGSLAGATMILPTAVLAHALGLPGLASISTGTIRGYVYLQGRAGLWLYGAAGTQQIALIAALRARGRQLDLGLDFAKGKFSTMQGAAAVRLERLLGRPIRAGAHEGVDLVDGALGNISLKGPLPIGRARSLFGLIEAIAKDLRFNTATQTIAIDITGLRMWEAAMLHAALREMANPRSKAILTFWGD